jgi:hypothetical protein
MRPAAGFAQTQAIPLSDEEELERDFTDPLSTLPQLIIWESYTPANYGPGPCTSQECLRNYETNQLPIRPLIPRIPSESLLPFSQLIRPTFAVVTVQSSRGGTRTEFGDLSLFDVAVLPWPERQKTGLLIGVRPTFVFPTATTMSAGQGAWQADPHSARFTAVFRECWSVSLHKTRSPSPTRRPIVRRRIHLNFNLSSSFIFGTNGTYARQKLTGRWVGVVITPRSCRGALGSGERLCVRGCHP